MGDIQNLDINLLKQLAQKGVAVKKNEITNAALKSIFDSADTNHNGTLEISEINALISEYTQATEKKLTWTEKKYNTFNEIAISLLEKAGISKPTKEQIAEKIASLKKTNPNLKDGELLGKKIVAVVSQTQYDNVAKKEAKKKEGATKIQLQSAKQIVAELKDAIRGKNDTQKIQNVLSRIDNPEEMAEVNKLLAEEGYKADDMYSSIEKFIYEENNHSYTHTYNSTDYMEKMVQKWISNGTLKGKDAINAQARMAARVICDGGDGLGTNCDKIKKGIHMIKAPTGNKPEDAKAVYDQVNKIISNHSTFYGMGAKSKDLMDYLDGELWDGEVKYLQGILAQNDAIQGTEKAKAVSGLVQEAVEYAGTDIEYLQQALKGIKSPKDRKAIEAELKKYCEKKGIKPQIAGQDYLQAILYDECDTFAGISKDHKEIRKFNEMMIAQGAYTEEEIIKIRAEQAALEILDGGFDNIQDALARIKDKNVLAQVNNLLKSQKNVDLDGFLDKNINNQTKIDLLKSELAANNLLSDKDATNIALRLIQDPDFNTRAKGISAIRTSAQAQAVDKSLKASGSSLAEVMEKFNKEKAEYQSKAAIWDGLAYVFGSSAEYISDKYRNNTDISDNLYTESDSAVEIPEDKKAIYDTTVKDFETKLNKMKEDYQNLLDNQGFISGAVNQFCSIYNIGTTRDDIEARIEHDTESLRLYKLAAEGKLQKIVDGKVVNVSFEEVFKERQSTFITANGASISAIGNMISPKEEVTLDTDKTTAIAEQGTKLAAMDYAKEYIAQSWQELNAAAGTNDTKQLTTAIYSTLDKISKMSGKELSLEHYGYTMNNGIIVDKNNNPVPAMQLKNLITTLKQGLSDISSALLGTTIPQNTEDDKVAKLLNKGYESKLDEFKKEYKKAYGQEAPDNVIDSYRSTIQNGVMAVNIVTAIGAVIAAPFTGGGSLAVFTAAAGATLVTQGLEQATDANGWTNSEWTKTTTEALWNGALAVAGMKVGAFSEKAATGGYEFAAKIIAKNEKAITNIAKKFGYELSAKKLRFFSVMAARAEAAGVEISSDALQDFVCTYCKEGDINKESFWTNFAMSFIGNAAGHAKGIWDDLHIHQNGTNNIVDQVMARELLSGSDNSLENSLRNADLDQLGKQGVGLEYTRADFNQKIDDIIKDLPEAKQDELLQYFGFKKGQNGYDRIPKSDRPQGALPYEFRSRAKRLQAEIDNFTVKNKITVADPVLQEHLDILTKGMPELTYIIGKVQHSSHGFSLDVHTLKVLQDVMDSPAYKTLSAADKEVAKMTAILHDIAKKGGVTDKLHNVTSRAFAEEILDELTLAPETRNRVLNLIDNHHWFENFNTGKMSADDVLNTFGTGADLQIAQMMAKSDLSNIRSDFHLKILESGKKLTPAEFDAKFNAKMDEITLAARKADPNFKVQTHAETVAKDIDNLLSGTPTAEELVAAKRQISFITDTQTAKDLKDKLKNKIKNLDDDMKAKFDYLAGKEHLEEFSARLYNQVFNRVNDREIFYALDDQLNEMLGNLPAEYKVHVLPDDVLTEINNIKIDGIENMPWQQKQAASKAAIEQILNDPTVAKKVQARADFLAKLDAKFVAEADLPAKEKTFSNMFRYGEAGTTNAWCDGNNSIRNILENIVDKPDTNIDDLFNFIKENKGTLNTAQDIEFFYKNPKELANLHTLNNILNGKPVTGNIPKSFGNIENLPAPIKAKIKNSGTKLIRNQGDLLQNLVRLEESLSNKKLLNGKTIDVDKLLKNMENVQDYEFVQILGQSTVDGFFDNAIDLLSKVSKQGNEKDYARRIWEMAKDSQLYDNALKVIADNPNIGANELKNAAGLFDVKTYKNAKNILGTETDTRTVCMLADANYIAKNAANMSEIEQKIMLKKFFEKHNFSFVDLLADGKLPAEHIQLIKEQLQQVKVPEQLKQILPPDLCTPSGRSNLIANLNKDINTYMNTPNTKAGASLSKAIESSNVNDITTILKQNNIDVNAGNIQAILKRTDISSNEKRVLSIASAISEKADFSQVYVELRHMGLPDDEVRQITGLVSSKKYLNNHIGEDAATRLLSDSQHLAVLGTLDGGLGKSLDELKQMTPAQRRDLAKKHIDILESMSGKKLNENIKNQLKSDFYGSLNKLLKNQEVLNTTNISTMKLLKEQNGVTILDGNGFEGYFHGIGLLDTPDISKVAGAKSLTESFADRATLSTSYLSEGHYDVAGCTGLILEGDLAAFNPFDSQFFTRVSPEDMTQILFDNGTNTLNGLHSAYGLRKNYSNLLNETMNTYHCSREEAANIIRSRHTAGQEISMGRANKAIFNSGAPETYNEALLYNPKSKAIAYVGKPDVEIPPEILNLAKEWGVPIVLIPKK